MRIVIIQTAWSETNGSYQKVGKRFAAYQPLALLGLAAYAEQCGHVADIIDLEVEPYTIDQLIDRFRKDGVGIIGITCTTPVFFKVKDLARDLRTRLDIPIVVGGPHITIIGEEAFADEFDYAVSGEGHETLVELMDALENEGDLNAIDGLFHRANGVTRFNGDRKFLNDLDELPFPAWDKIDLSRYAYKIPGKGFVPVATIELTRGCPYKCTFCSEPLNTGRVLRRHTAEYFVDQIAYVKKRFEIDHFNIIDSTLTLNRKLIEEMCHELIRRKVNITFEGQTRSNLVNRDLLALMKEAGLRRICFGIESANPKVLHLMKKEVAVQDMRDSIGYCKELGIDPRVGLMMGNAGDTRETILETAWFVRSIPEILFAPLGIAVPYPGTEMYEFAKRGMHGLRLLTEDFDNFSRWSGGVMEVDGMMPAELLKLQRKAMFIIHLTPRRVISLLRHFGIKNVVTLGFIQVWHLMFDWLAPAQETVRIQSISHNNTTIKNIQFR